MKTFLKFIWSVFSSRGWLRKFYANPPGISLNYTPTSLNNPSSSFCTARHHERPLVYYVVNRQWSMANGQLHHESQSGHYPLGGALYA